MTRCGHAPGLSCEPGASRSTRPAGATPGRSSDVERAQPGSTSPTARRWSRLNGTTWSPSGRCAHGLPGEPRHELLGRDRPAEQVALRLVAAVLPQHRLGIGALHALGDGPQPEAPAELDERPHDDGVLVVHGHRHDERLVDLQLGDRKAAQVGERGVAGAEVVDREPHAELLQPEEHGHRSVALAHDGRLGQLEGQGRGRHVGLLDRLADVLDEVGVEEVPTGQVHRDVEVEPGVAPRPALRQRIAHHVGRELADDAGVLGRRDELIGRQRARAGGASSGRAPRPR